MTAHSTIIELKDLLPGSLVHMFYQLGNINNQRFKVVHVGCEDDQFYAVLKYYSSRHDCGQLKTITEMEWEIMSYYEIAVEETTDEFEWLKGNKKPLGNVKAMSQGAKKIETEQ